MSQTQSRSRLPSVYFPTLPPPAPKAAELRVVESAYRLPTFVWEERNFAPEPTKPAAKPALEVVHDEPQPIPPAAFGNGRMSLKQKKQAKFERRFERIESEILGRLSRITDVEAIESISYSQRQKLGIGVLESASAIVKQLSAAIKRCTSFHAVAVIETVLVTIEREQERRAAKADTK